MSREEQQQQPNMVSLNHKEINRLMTKHMTKHMVDSYAQQGELMDVIFGRQAPSKNPPPWLAILEGSDIFWVEIRRLWSNNARALHKSDTGCLSSPDGHQNTSHFTMDQEASDPSLKYTPLPEDHPIHMLEEAKSFFRSRPEYAPCIGKRNDTKVKGVVIPTVRKKRPQYPEKASVVLREWDSRRAVWTIDLNHKRLIVKHNSKGGAGYLWWPGGSINFEGPIALSIIKPRTSIFRKARTETIELYSEEEGPGSPSTQGLGNGRILESTARFVDNTALKVEDQDTPPSAQDFKEQRAMIADSPNDRSLLKRKAPTADDPELRLDFGAERSRHEAQTQSFASMSSPMQHETHGPVAKRRKTDVSRRELHQLHGIAPLSTRPASQSRRVSTVQSSQEEDSHVHSMTSMPDFLTMPLSKYKQDNTKLRLWPDGSDSCTRTRFRACPTSIAFFNLITKALESPRDSVKKTTVIFTWMH